MSAVLDEDGAAGAKAAAPIVAATMAGAVTARPAAAVVAVGAATSAEATVASHPALCRSPTAAAEATIAARSAVEAGSVVQQIVGENIDAATTATAEPSVSGRSIVTWVEAAKESAACRSGGVVG